MRPRRTVCGRRLAALLAWVALTAAAPAQAGVFDTLPQRQRTVQVVSDAANTSAYKLAAAQALYAVYAAQVRSGKMPAWTHAVAVTEVDVDASGRITAVRLVREPAHAKEVGPWLVGLLWRMQRLPVPLLLGATTWREVWLVDEQGRFQVDTLTEGQEAP